jgi:hypothetical protein
MTLSRASLLSGWLMFLALAPVALGQQPQQSPGPSVAVPPFQTGTESLESAALAKAASEEFSKHLIVTDPGLRLWTPPAPPAPPTEAELSDDDQMKATARAWGADYLVLGALSGSHLGTTRIMDALAGEVISISTGGDYEEAAQKAAAAIREREKWLDERPETHSLRIVVKWGIESATDNYGYLVHRSETGPEGEYRPITRRMLPGAGTTSIPHIYRYIDKEVEAGKTYHYKVEEVDRGGAKVFFRDPVSGDIMTLSGQPKPMSRREQMKYGVEAFHAEKVER